MSPPAAKLSMRQRIDLLADPGSFVPFFGGISGTVTTGTALVEGRRVAIVASQGDVVDEVIREGLRRTEPWLKTQEMAEKLGLPLFYLLDSGAPGALPSATTETQVRPELEAFVSRRGFPRIYFNQARLSGRAPQVCIVFGVVGRATTWITGMCDALVIVDGNGVITLGGTRLAQDLLGEAVSLEELGGARTHCALTGMGDELVRSDAEALAWSKRCLSYLVGPREVAGHPTEADRSGRSLEEIVPRSENTPFPIKDLIREFVDAGSLLEMKRLFAREIVTTFARIEGWPVGIVANDSSQKGGILFAESCAKASRFVSLCDSWGVPLLFVVDCPGFMVGRKAEQSGIVQAGALLFKSLIAARVPKVCVVVRKALTASLFAMCAPAFDPDAYIALPGAAIDIYGEKLRRLITERCAREGRVWNPPPEGKAEDLARQLLIDEVVPFEGLRATLAHRLALAAGRLRSADAPASRS